MRNFIPEDVCCGLLSESALFAKYAQTHDGFVVFFKKLLVHTRIHTYLTVSPLSCVSCVPASCVLIWFVSCPAVFVWLSMIILCIYSPICSVSVRLVTPGVLVYLSCLVLPCLSELKTVYLSLSSSRVPRSSPLCAPWHWHENRNI